METKDIEMIDVVDRAQQGDMQAFETLVTTYEKQVYALVLGIVKDDTNAQDVTQDVFVKIHQRLGMFQGKSAFGTWLYRIAYNEALDFLRREKRHQALSFDDLKTSDEDDSHWDLEDTNYSISQNIEQNDLQRIVQESLMEVPEDYRLPLILHDMQRITYEEIAEQLNCPVGTVKSRIFRARKIFRSYVLRNRELFDGYARLNGSESDKEV